MNADMPGNTTPQHIRMFVAILTPEDIQSGMEQAQAELRRAASKARIGWTTQFHLTLKFLGDVEAGRVEPLTEALRRACLGFAPLAMRAERIGFFPDPCRPRVVWAGVRDQRDELPRLQAAVESASREFTTEEPEKQFIGHITLGRIKAITRRDGEALAKAASGMAGRFFGEWQAAQVALMRSELSPTGARHTCVAVVSF
jgi:2'-5' RNA ligase